MSLVPETECAAHLLANKITQDTMIGRILASTAPREHSKHWRPLSDFPSIDETRLSTALQARLIGDKGLVVSFSHDHYLTIGGGLQNCVSLEQSGYGASGWCYLHLCPYRPLPVLSDDLDPSNFEVVASLDGHTAGAVPLTGVIDALSRVSGTGARIAVVHQLLGHSPELVQEVVRTLGNAKVYFWTHDLFAHCPTVHLLRNDAAFCGGPPPSSSACAICHAGADRALHLARMAQFFSATRPTLLAPSRTILDMWCRLNNFVHDGAHVLPPCRFHSGAAVAPSAGALRVGFLGTAFFQKGWESFAELVLRFGADPRYQFYQLGWQAEHLPNLTHRTVKVTPQDCEAMARSVAECGIDVAINWSLCFESFSFTAIEALAGGAFLVARRGAGNVFPLVQSIDPACGIEVATTVELQALFANGEIIELARRAPRRTGSLEMARGAAALLGS